MTREEIERLAKASTAEIRRAFLGDFRGIVSSVVLRDLEAAVRAGDADRAWRVLSVTPGAFRDLTEAQRKAFLDGGVVASATIDKGLRRPQFAVEPGTAAGAFRFVMDDAAEAVIKRDIGKLIADISDEARGQLSERIQLGLRHEEHPKRIALDIVGRRHPGTHTRSGGMIGLTRKQNEWVANAAGELETPAGMRRYLTRKSRDRRFDRSVARALREGAEIPAETRRKMIDSYRSRLLKMRGETIGRTEALRSINAGVHAGFGQAVEQKRVKAENVVQTWLTSRDRRVRDTHGAMDRQTRRYGEPFESPSGARMRYPLDGELGAPASELIRCRCIVITEFVPTGERPKREKAGRPERRDGPGREDRLQRIDRDLLGIRTRLQQLEGQSGRLVRNERFSLTNKRGKLLAERKALRAQAPRPPPRGGGALADLEAEAALAKQHSDDLFRQIKALETQVLEPAVLKERQKLLRRDWNKSRRREGALAGKIREERRRLGLDSPPQRPPTPRPEPEPPTPGPPEPTPPVRPPPPPPRPPEPVPRPPPRRLPPKPEPRPADPPPRRAEPVPSSRTTTYEQANRTTRSMEEEAWHVRSWNDAPDDMLEAVGRSGSLDRVEATRANAHYKTNKRVIDMGTRRMDTRAGQAMWRHEFGHWLDEDWVPGLGRNFSNSNSFMAARAADRKLLEGISSRDLPGANRHLFRKVKKEAAAVRELDDVARRQALERMAVEADLDLAEVEGWLRRNGALGADGFSPANQDMMTWRFMRAWKDRDSQGLLDSLLGDSSLPFAKGSNQIPGAARLARHMETDAGSGTNLSDLFDGLMRGKVSGKWKHTDDYYRQSNGLRDAEIFANIIESMGESDFGGKLIQRFMPEMHKLVKGKLDDIAGGAGRAASRPPPESL